MKSTITYNLKTIMILFMFSFWSCERVVPIPPPDPSIEKKLGTGNSDAKSMLFVLNERTTRFVNEASLSTHVVSDSVLQYFTNDVFARSTTSDPSAIRLDVFPTLNSSSFMSLQTPPNSSIDNAEFPGAFGETVSANWHINSEWFLLEPQNKDYGYNPETVVVIEGRITENTTWTANNKYLLKGQVFVENDVTLTIEPGTTIFGIRDVGVNAGVLCFNKGSKVIANGTPEQPIVFTGTAPPGQRAKGQWGGVIFCGDGLSNRGEKILIPGIQGGGENDGKYGGNNPNYDAGEISYWRIEYAGIAVTPGNELNSFTFGGIGSATKAHHLIVSYAGDDALEWFGGNMNCKYIATYATLDDDMDMDQGFSGNIQYVYSVRNPFSADESGSSNLEVTSSKSTGAQPQTRAVLSNITVVAPLYQLQNSGLIADPQYRGGVHSTKDAACHIINSVIIGALVGVDNP